MTEETKVLIREFLQSKETETLIQKCYCDSCSAMECIDILVREMLKPA